MLLQSEEMATYNIPEQSHCRSQNKLNHLISRCVIGMGGRPITGLGKQRAYDGIDVCWVAMRRDVRTKKTLRAKHHSVEVRRVCVCVCVCL